MGNLNIDSYYEILKKRKKYFFKEESIKHIPDQPGVYMFYDKKESLLYIGKAKSLPNRLRSYVVKNLFGKTAALVKKITYFSYIPLKSNLKSIFVESMLINKFKPRYNIELKDDKSYVYVVIAKSKYPYLLFSRERSLKSEYLKFYGPFLNKRELNGILKILRKFIPYSTHKEQKRPCIDHQLGLCDPCPSIIEKETNSLLKSEMKMRYMNNLKMLDYFFKGRYQKMHKYLNEMMLTFSNNEKYEDANKIKEKLLYLDEIFENIRSCSVKDFHHQKNDMGNDIMFSNDILLSYNKRINEYLDLKRLFKDHNINIKYSGRFECYDISHISGSFAVASMVVFEKFVAVKSRYRHFRLKQSINNDVLSLSEVARRRSMHFGDWGTPELIIVDGGRAQINAFLKVMRKYSVNVIGVEKRYEKIVIPKNNSFVSVKLSGNALHFVQRMRDESHRFAQRYHHKLISKYIKDGDNIIL